jgi:predicted heme/steroid binding protein
MFPSRISSEEPQDLEGKEVAYSGHVFDPNSAPAWREQEHCKKLVVMASTDRLR